MRKTPKKHQKGDLLPVGEGIYVSVNMKFRGTTLHGFSSIFLVKDRWSSALDGKRVRLWVEVIEGKTRSGGVRRAEKRS